MSATRLLTAPPFAALGGAWPWPWRQRHGGDSGLDGAGAGGAAWGVVVPVRRGGTAMGMGELGGVDRRER